MGSVEQLQRQLGGFDFSNHSRNVALLQRAAAAGVGGAAAAGAAAAGYPPLRKTGTTICGVVFSGGVVLGSDTRATEGPLVADKNCNKLHRISNNIYAAGAGTAADLDHMCDWLSSQVALHSMNRPRVGMAVCVLSQELFKYQGYRGCAVVLGGVDLKGPSLYKIHPHGSTDSASYAAMGSGSLNAMAVLEAGQCTSSSNSNNNNSTSTTTIDPTFIGSSSSSSSRSTVAAEAIAPAAAATQQHWAPDVGCYKDGLTEAEACALVCSAITAGVMNDLGSGGNVDLCVITPEGTRHTRKYASPAREAQKAVYTPYEPGTTPFFREHIEQVQQQISVQQEVEMVEAQS
ncbi:hypothetical protein ACSSS7_006970 [Eimeria intestinalis]